MWTARLGPYLVGVLRWRSPQPCLTVVVKTTLSLGRDGPMRPSATQLGLCGDHRGMGASDDELEHASDFAPRKSRADVLVVGNARAARPTTHIPVALEIAGATKRLDACAGSATSFVPLASTHLRCGSDAVRTAPSALRVPEWAARELPPGFDFTRFNVAPVDQRTDWLTPGTRVVLRGLWPDAPRREAWLPDLEPRVFYLPLGVAHGNAREIRVVADTLWIHVDREICALTWRGVLERAPAATESEQLVVAPHAQCQGGFAEAAQLLDRAVWDHARQEQDVHGPPTEHAVDAQGSPLTSEAAGPAVDDDGDDRTTALHRDDETSSARAHAPLASTTASTGHRGLAEAADVEDEPAPITPRAGLALGAGLGSALGGVVLCAERPGSNALPYTPTQPRDPARSPAAPSPRADASDQTVAGAPAPFVQPVLPFVETRTGTAPPPVGPLPSPSSTAGSGRPSSTGTAPPPPPAHGPAGPATSASRFTSTVAMEAAPEPSPARPGAPPVKRPHAQTLALSEGLGVSTAPLPFRATPASHSAPLRQPPGLPFAPASASAPSGPTSGGTMPPAAPTASSASPFVAGSGTMPPRSAAPTSAPAAAAGAIPAPPPTPASAAAATSGTLPPAPPRVLPVSASPTTSGTMPPTPPLVAPSMPRIPAPPSLPRTAGPAWLAASSRPAVPSPPVSVAAPTTPRRSVTFGSVSSIALETYAAVKSALWEPNASLVDVLAARHVDEAQWHETERKLELALEQEAADGGSELASIIRAALMRAGKAGAEAELPSLTVEEYAELRVAMDAVEDTAPVLDAQGLSLAQWHELRRSWHRRALDDPELDAQVKTAVAKARRAARARRLGPEPDAS